MSAQHTPGPCCFDGGAVCGMHPNCGCAEAAKQMPRIKVERSCPRCRVRAYHWGNVHGFRDRIECVNCGHAWQGRIRNDEQRAVIAKATGSAA